MAIKTWAQIDPQGNVTCVAQFETNGSSSFTNPQGVVFVEPPEGVDAVTVMQSYKWNGAWTFVGPSPSSYHDWDGMQWSFNLTRARADKWAEIKTARESAEYGGFSIGVDMYDSDAVSQSRIQGAVIKAMRDPTMSIDWTLADNTIKTLSASEIIDMGDALAAHVMTQHEKARYFRSQIEAATTQAELDAILWS